MSFRLTAAAFLLASSATPLLAEDTPAPAADAQGDHHGAVDDTIVITALSRGRDDFLGGVSVLGGAELAAAKRTSIGETLANLPGVSATSFGPSASRPVLRGFQGDRIRVLIDGIGSFDASSSSADHAVAINPLIAERIEVLRGPSALMYGSSAIGGVVNVFDSRIPRKVPDEAVHLDADLDYASAANERRGGAVADVPLGGGFVAHLDGSYAKTDDLRTGGYLLSPALRAQAAATPDAETRELADLRGKLPNTESKSSEVAGGLAYIGSGGSLGFSVSRLDNRYGVPIRFSLDPAVAAEAPTLDVRQYRADLRAEITPVSGAFEAIRFRAGYGDYRHFEIEDTGEIATTFLNDGMEARIDFVQRRKGAWSGAFGGQYLTRDFTVIGDEAFLPPTQTEQGGLFTVQNLEFGAVKLETGGRYEHTSVDTAGASRRFDTYSGSLGGSIAVIDGWRIGANISHSERAPTAEELFANGPHLATQAFEQGNPAFAKERSNGGELTLRGRGDGYSIEVSAYYNDFGRFIYQTPTDEIEDDLPVYQYAAAGARQWGLEGEATVTLAEIGAGRLVADILGDYVRVTIDGVGPAPFIPPLRVLGGLEYQSERIDARAEVEHVTSQDRIADFETPTAGYTMTNARIEWRPMGRDGIVSFRLAANNIFDVTARRHASFLKDFAPLAGRDIRVGASIRF